MGSFRQVFQTDSMDCGAACLCMIARHYGKKYSMRFFRENAHISREGISMLGLSMAAEKVGFRTLSAKITVEQLAEQIALPCILHWDGRHYVVCHRVSGKGSDRVFHICDPAIGKIRVRGDELRSHWLSGHLGEEEVGLAMQLEPAPDFREKQPEDPADGFGLLFFSRYILPHKWQLAGLLFGALVVMTMGYFLPFISQSVVDIGILGRNMDFIVLMMAMQLMISFSQTTVMFMQGWVSLHVNTVINVRLISDYLGKLARMPLPFFEVRTLGDILQRIGDHDRIKSFLMNDLTDIVFATVTFVTFSVVLGIYNWRILAIFLLGNTAYALWVVSFMHYRRELDNRVFQQSATLQNNMVQFIRGMQEIKLNNLEERKCREWESLQAGLYRLGRRGLMIGQVQQAGLLVFSTTTGIAISYMTARRVVDGEMTLGMMTSLSFILGQVSGPIGSFIGFIQRYQDARISLERLGDIHARKEGGMDEGTGRNGMPTGKDIRFRNVSFSYNGMDRDMVLKDISFTIPQGHVTAIVGRSGCGKTTLMKLMQGFYQPVHGTVEVGGTPLPDISLREWRTHLGAVMQDGYIFSDSIAGNVAVDEDADMARVEDALEAVNMKGFVHSLPNGTDTKIGEDGLQLSQGQRQRILLARVIYKRPEYIFLDEATNSLDTKNENDIMAYIKKNLKGHTVIIVAHRLSTIRDADSIVVLENGRVAEQGVHSQLLCNKGIYYQLVQAQLDNIQ